jgi:hypothetical protein
MIQPVTPEDEKAEKEERLFFDSLALWRFDSAFSDKIYMEMSVHTVYNNQNRVLL